MNRLADGQLEHAVLAAPNVGEAYRQQEIWDLKTRLAYDVAARIRQRYETEIAPAYAREHGAAPTSRHVIGELMAEDPATQMWSALRRSGQEQMWALVADSTARQLSRLTGVAGSLLGSTGSLTLDASVQVPAYLQTVDIHCMPTGYYRETGPDDLTAGALYDRGVYIYAAGQLGAANDDKGRSVIEHYLDVHHPGLAPAAILDMGCSVGHSTLPYAERYPEAEVHAIDVAAPMLRYAHARAASFGLPVHFAQRDAEATGYAAGSFDLVVSHILLHETSTKAVQNILTESFRLLKPGGLMIHAEYPPFTTMDPFAQFLVEWDTTNNNEPFWSTVRTLDLEAMAARAGFEPGQVSRELIPTGRRLVTGQSSAGRIGLIVARR
ncbi:class I SAM-dependent methyltransferase [Dactylosporangium sp. NPDC000244]|uniref:class I SAM-dependent methyltransferase n=1 Tax=Dactylosporangium sp. NPDC000244 TaxID=3154365 RepID=UPI003321B664